MPMDPAAIASMNQVNTGGTGGGGSSTIIQERIVYRDRNGEDKENNAELEE